MILSALFIKRNNIKLFFQPEERVAATTAGSHVSVPAIRTVEAPPPVQFEITAGTDSASPATALDAQDNIFLSELFAGDPNRKGNKVETTMSEEEAIREAFLPNTATTISFEEKVVSARGNIFGKQFSVGEQVLIVWKDTDRNFYVEWFSNYAAFNKVVKDGKIAIKGTIPLLTSSNVSDETTMYAQCNRNKPVLTTRTVHEVVTTDTPGVPDLYNLSSTEVDHVKLLNEGLSNLDALDQVNIRIQGIGASMSGGGDIALAPRSVKSVILPVVTRLIQAGSSVNGPVSRDNRIVLWWHGYGDGQEVQCICRQLNELHYLEHVEIHATEIDKYKVTVFNDQRVPSVSSVALSLVNIDATKHVIPGKRVDMAYAAFVSGPHTILQLLMNLQRNKTRYFMSFDKNIKYVGSVMKVGHFIYENVGSVITEGKNGTTHQMWLVTIHNDDEVGSCA